MVVENKLVLDMSDILFTRVLRYSAVGGLIL